MARNAQLHLEGKDCQLPIVEGTEGELAVDISTLRQQSGYITLDDGYANTGSCTSAITFIDGEKGILRYRGIPIEELAEEAAFVEVAYLLIYGHLPSNEELSRFSGLLTQSELLHEDMRLHFQAFPAHAHPMAILSSMINATGCFEPDSIQSYNPHTFERQAAMLMSQARTIAAFAFSKSRGLPTNYPNPIYKYTPNLLHMMFSLPHQDYMLIPEVVRALDMLFVLHADHEQNCSTSTVRMIASSRANLFASIAGGVCALWGPLHGGANQSVIEMLEHIHRSGDDGSQAIAAARSKTDPFRLMGFGHRVYKNYDPRAKILKQCCDDLLRELRIDDPLLDIARRLEEAALSEPYFRERNLYPNVDFYSGIIMRAIGIPVEMFTVMFAIGRIPGWIAHYRELMESGGGRIYRPRQIYTGQTRQHVIPLDER